MQLEEIISILTTTRNSQCYTVIRNGSSHRCPACGETLDGSNWRISNAFNCMKICSKCKDLDLDDPTPEACAEILKSWWVIQTYEKAGPFPADSIVLREPQVNDDGTVTFLDSNCYFDWAEKFGLDPTTFEDEDTWLNVYFTVDPKTLAVSVEYTIDDNEKNERFVYAPTIDDTNSVLASVARYCKQCGETLQEIVERVLHATEEEQEFEIPVKEINYGIAKIRATSLEAALEKVHDAYGNGKIDWGKTEFDFIVPMGGADCG